MKVGVIGSGYVGLVAAACFAEMGNNVICVDIDDHKISQLIKGVVPIYEPGLSTLVIDNQKKGTLKFATNSKEALGKSEVVFIASLEMQEMSLLIPLSLLRRMSLLEMEHG